MARRQTFEDLPRDKQRTRLLRRLNATRRECEQHLADVESFNDSQRSKGRWTVPASPEIVSALA